jgi:hypothetical protein
MLLEAYRAKRLVLIMDGLDEAPDLREQIESFVLSTLVPDQIRFLLTSR